MVDIRNSSSEHSSKYHDPKDKSENILKNTEWVGDLAVRWGLTGDYNSLCTEGEKHEHYTRVLEGRHPINDHDLVKTAGEGRKRAALVVTFSAPKTFSIAEHIYGD